MTTTEQFIIRAASRTRGITYAVRDVVELASKTAATGREMLYLNIGDPNQFDFVTPTHLIEAVHAARELLAVNSVRGALPIVELDGGPVGDGEPGGAGCVLIICTATSRSPQTINPTRFAVCSTPARQRSRSGSAPASA